MEARLLQHSTNMSMQDYTQRELVGRCSGCMLIFLFQQAVASLDSASQTLTVVSGQWGKDNQAAAAALEAVNKLNVSTVAAAKTSHSMVSPPCA
jgi:hypothetical protein